MNALQLVAMTALIPAAAQAKVAVMPVESTNLAPEEAEAIGVLVAQAYGREAQVEVMGPRQTLAVVGSSENLEAAAHALGVDQFILVSAVRLSYRVNLHAGLHDAQGHELYVIDMVAPSLDDMPFAAARLAKALFSRQRPEELWMRRNLMTWQEPGVHERGDVHKVFGIKVAFSQPVARGARFNSNVTLAFDFRYEFERSFVELATGFNFTNDGPDNNLSGWFADVGASYFITNGNHALYVGAGISPRMLWYDPSRATADIAPYLQVGYMMFRASRTRLYFDLRATQNLVPIRYGYDYNQCGWDVCYLTKHIYPTELALYVGLGW